jgi:hypothetical protein
MSACGGPAPEPAQPTATSQPVEPTEAPTEPPTEAPTEEPTEAPTEEPTEAPTEEPTEAPTEESTEAPAEQPVSIDAQTLLEERCVDCHTLDRVTNSAKSQVGWDQTVTRMVKRGAQLNDEEQAALIDYLTETYGQ